jgi:hypothetical protein
MGCNMRMSKGIHRLPKVKLGPTMPYHYTPCGWQPLYQGWPPAELAAYSRLATLLDTPCHTPLIINIKFLLKFNVSFVRVSFLNGFQFLGV